VSQDEAASEALTPRQFSLGSLLWFVLLASLWCSQIAVVRELVLAGTYVLKASSVASVLVAWIALSWFCFHQRLFLILAIQCMVPAFLGLGALLLSFGDKADLFVDPWKLFFGMTLCANLISFPIGAINMAIRWVWPAANRKQHDRRMPRRP
jgi:hypothetical protein